LFVKKTEGRGATTMVRQSGLGGFLKKELPHMVSQHKASDVEKVKASLECDFPMYD
jgi:hypothetical protein